MSEIKMNEINKLFSALEREPGDGWLTLRALNLVSELYDAGIFRCTARALLDELARLVNEEI